MKFKEYVDEDHIIVSEDEKVTAIIGLFQQEEPVTDEEVHALAEAMNMEPDEFEAIIYGMLQSFWSKGRAMEKDIGEKDVDPKELEMGIEVEYEHTDSKEMSTRIALDHLAELDDYYTRLEVMEEEGGMNEGIMDTIGKIFKRKETEPYDPQFEEVNDVVRKYRGEISGIGVNGFLVTFIIKEAGPSKRNANKSVIALRKRGYTAKVEKWDEVAGTWEVHVIRKKK